MRLSSLVHSSRGFLVFFAIALSSESLRRTRSVLTARLDEHGLAFRRNRDRRDCVIPLDGAMQFPEMAAIPSNFFKAIGGQLSANAPATQSLYRAISNVHCRFSFAAELVESLRRMLAAALAASLSRMAWLGGS
jgi:hypothetical protein